MASQNLESSSHIHLVYNHFESTFRYIGGAHTDAVYLWVSREVMDLEKLLRHIPGTGGVN